MRFLDAEFVQGFIRMANDGWEQGWHERNGGNLSYRVKPEEVDYINAHGTSTPMNDKLETAAIKKAFKNHAHKVAVSSTKGNTGHCLGAAGGIEGVLCVKALEDNFIPATINYQNFDEECDLDIVANHGRKQVLNYVMSNSLGFGGHNASIIFKKYGEE